VSQTPLDGAGTLATPAHRPQTPAELFARFELGEATSKHLLILYSLAVGSQAQVIVDLGLGQTTGALRAAASKTGGHVYSCDFDQRRWRHLLAEQDERWTLFLEPARQAIDKIPEPVDFAVHDAAHNYRDVRRDLERLLPKMRRYAMLCVHDTQHARLYGDMLAAIRDATRGWAVSLTNLPFYSGMALIRMEEARHPPLQPCPDEKGETFLAPFATLCWKGPCREGLCREPDAVSTGARPSWLRLAEFWKVRFAYRARQWGLPGGRQNSPRERA
jgi:hypothetical protein